MITAQRLYADAVWLAYRTRIVNDCFGSAMSPHAIAQTIPDETIELLMIWKAQG